MMLEIAFLIILILNSNCYIPIPDHSERAHTLSQYDQLTTSRFYLESLAHCYLMSIFSNLGWMKKEELVHHKVVKLGKIGICRMKQAGVVTLGSLTKAEECLLVDGRKASQGWEVSLSQIQPIVYKYQSSLTIKGNVRL